MQSRPVITLYKTYGHYIKYYSHGKPSNESINAGYPVIISAIQLSNICKVIYYLSTSGTVYTVQLWENDNIRRYSRCRLSLQLSGMQFIISTLVFFFGDFLAFYSSSKCLFYTKTLIMKLMRIKTYGGICSVYLCIVTEGWASSLFVIRVL